MLIKNIGDTGEKERNLQELRLMHERVMVTVTILPYWCYGYYSVIHVAAKCLSFDVVWCRRWDWCIWSYVYLMK